jgi:hypothetical protein
MSKPPTTEQAMETIAAAMKEISGTTKTILEVQKQFNDNFILHANTADNGFKAICKEADKTNAAIAGMRKDFNNWFYPLFTKIVLATMAIAGASVGMKLFGFW